MEKERKAKILALVALIVAVLGLTVAFASLSQTLTINGTANMEPANWDIHLENLNVTEKGIAGTYYNGVNGEAKIIKMPTISADGLSLTGFEVSLKKPGDGVSFDIDIVNAGDIDAKLEDIIFNGLSLSQFENECENADDSDACYNDAEKRLAKSMFEEADWDGNGETTEEEKLEALKYIEFSSQAYDNDACGNNKCINNAYEFSWLELYPDSVVTNILKPNHFARYEINIYFSSNGDTLPKGDVILKPNVKFVFTQS